MCTGLLSALTVFIHQLLLVALVTSNKRLGFQSGRKFRPKCKDDQIYLGQAYLYIPRPRILGRYPGKYPWPWKPRDLPRPRPLGNPRSVVLIPGWFVRFGVTWNKIYCQLSWGRFGTRQWFQVYLTLICRPLNNESVKTVELFTLSLSANST